MVSRAHRLLQISNIVGGCPDKESVVVDTLFGGSLQLHFHASQVGDGGLVVWHVKEGCDATAHGSCGTGAQIFFFRLTGISEMALRIDHPR